MLTVVVSPSKSMYLRFLNQWIPHSNDSQFLILTAFFICSFFIRHVIVAWKWVSPSCCQPDRMRSLLFFSALFTWIRGRRPPLIIHGQSSRVRGCLLSSISVCSSRRGGRLYPPYSVYPSVRGGDLPSAVLGLSELERRKALPPSLIWLSRRAGDFPSPLLGLSE